MSKGSEPLIVIPARLASSRLPGKPLKKIGNKTLIEHCVDSARKAGVRPYVVSDSMDVVSAAGMFPLAPSVRKALVSQSDCETGTDRVAEFVERTLGWERAPDWIINVQGDMPFGTAPFIKALIEATKDPSSGAITIEAYDQSVRCEQPLDCWSQVSFRRWHTYKHVGMYAYHKDVLKAFYECGTQREERQFGLEQLRFRHINVWVDVVTIDDHLPPIEVNTQADLDRINEIVNACAGFGNPSLTADEAASLAMAGGG